MRERAERREPEAAPPRPQPAAPRLDPAGLLALQGSAGNAAVTRMIVARQEQATATATQRREIRPGDRDENAGYAPLRGYRQRGPDQHTRFTHPEEGGDVELMQLKLNYHLSAAHQVGIVVDGSHGPQSVAALRRFKRLRRIRPADGVCNQATWDALDAEPVSSVPAAVAGGPSPDYAQMLGDGLLQVTLAMGFDEGGQHSSEPHEVRRGLIDVRGYRVDPDRAAQLAEAAGQPAPAAGGELLVKENAGRSQGRPFHVIVRLVRPSPDGRTGGQTAADAAATGMNESEVFAYGGHARYGTGPDFDRNWTMTVHWDRVPEGRRSRQPAGESETPVPSVRHFLALFNVSDGRAAIELFEELRQGGGVTFAGNPQGNLGINPGAPQTHAGELGNHLIRLATEGQPARVLDAVQSRRYRLWLFNGCVTREYMHTLRQSGREQFSPDQMDVITNVVPPWVITLAEGVLAYFDGVVAQEGARALVDRMQNAHPPSDDRYGYDF